MSPTFIEQIDSPPGMGRSLVAHDPESRNYPVRGVLTTAGIKRISRSWRRGSPPYNQGQSNSCVGQTFKGILNTSPAALIAASAVRTRYDAYDFYQGAQQNDEWPGGEPEYFGTSALGCCKYLATKGLVKEYRWCFGIDDVLDTLSQHGPVAIGINWYEGMMSTDTNGFINPSGRPIGGHETELLGINVASKYVWGVNSWGVNWGVKGRYKLSWDSLDALLHQNGDAVTVVRV